MPMLANTEAISPIKYPGMPRKIEAASQTAQPTGRHCTVPRLSEVVMNRFYYCIIFEVSPNEDHTAGSGNQYRRTSIMRFVQLACVSLAALALSGAVSAQPRCNSGNANYNYNYTNGYNNGYNGYNQNLPSQCGQPYYNANLPVGNVYYNNGYANSGSCNSNRNYSYNNNNNGRWNNNGNYWYGNNNNNNGRRHHRHNNNNNRHCR
jgi:hypothetical protein